MNKLPIAKNTNIVEQELGKESLIYNLNTHQFFNLNETSTIVYKACDGNTTFSDLKSKHKFTDDLIFLALDHLKEAGLIEETAYVSPFNGLSRREAIRKVGLASMVTLPVISGLLAPTAAHAQSGVVGLGANCSAATCSPGLVCTNQFGGGNLCRATPGGTCSFGRPDLCTTGCCTTSPSGPVCCSN